MKVRTAIAIAVLVPLLGIGIALVPGDADERWEAMVAWAREAEQQWRGRDFRREPAWGTATKGAAFPVYAEAIEQARVLGKVDHRLLQDLRQRPDAVAPAVAEDFGRRWRPALLALSAGAHMDDARPPMDWQKGLKQRPAPLMAGRDLVNAAAIEARRRIAAGDGRGAVELVLDAATYAVDLQHSPVFVDQMIACALLQSAAGEALRDEDLRRLDPATLELLGQGLDRLDARIPVLLDARGEALLLARSLMGPAAGRGEAAAHGGDRTWQQAWSKHWAAADAVLALAGCQRDLAAAAELPWPPREVRMRELVAALKAPGNAWLEQSCESFVSLERMLRQSLARVRLLRLCVAFHAGGALPVLADPMAEGPLQVERRDGGATFAAAGDADRRIERTATAR